MKNNLKTGSSIDSLEIDLVEILSRTVVDTTINKVILKPKEVEEIPVSWTSFINNVLKNNDLERLLKTDVKYKSKYGKNYVGFDYYKKNLIIWIADENNGSNQSIRINGMETFATSVVRTYASALGASILTNKIIYTNKTRSVLFQGGFGVNKAKSDEGNKNEYKKIDPSTFPMDFTSLTTPEYIVDAFEDGTYNHNLGVIPCLEFLNKDVKDNYNDEVFLSDWYPAKDIMDMINALLVYIAWEMNLNHTRVIGLFSNQDIKGITPATNNPIELAGILKRNIASVAQYGSLSGEDQTINKKLILKTIGSSDTDLEVMQSTFDSLKQVDGLNSFIVTFYKICGYSWGSETNQVYENVSQTQNSNKGVFETTKEKIELFTRQWKKLLTYMAFAYFKEEGIAMNFERVQEEFDLYVDFKLISNVIQEVNNDWKKTLEIFQAGVLSDSTTLKLLYPEWSSKQLKEEADKIQEKNDKENEMFLDNEDPFGSEDDKDNNDLNEKGNEDE